MTNLEVLGLGRDELLRMFKDGELGPTTAWAAIKGAGAYVAAGLTDGFHDEATACGNARQCMSCRMPSGMPTVQWRDTCRDGVRAGYCGEPGKEDQVNPDRCGCFVLISVNGQMEPGAKPRVKGGMGKCPQGKF